MLDASCESMLRLQGSKYRHRAVWPQRTPPKHTCKCVPLRANVSGLLLLQRLQGNLGCYLDLCSALLSHIAALASAAAAAAAHQQQQGSHYLLEQQRLQQAAAAAALPQLEAVFANGGLPNGGAAHGQPNGLPNGVPNGVMPNGVHNGVGGPAGMLNGSGGVLPNGNGVYAASGGGGPSSMHMQVSPFANGSGAGGAVPVVGNGVANGHMHS